MSARLTESEAERISLATILDDRLGEVIEQIIDEREQAAFEAGRLAGFLR